MFFRVCPYCGAALDPGEKCDCKINNDYKQIIPIQTKEDRKFRWDSKGQLEMRLS